LNKKRFVVVATALAVGASGLAAGFDASPDEQAIVARTVVITPPSSTSVPVTEAPIVEASTTSTTTTTTVDLSNVDWTELARSAYGQCGEFHDLAMSVGWTEAEWPTLSKVMWRESRCTTDAWNGADAGLTQVNQIHTEWLATMGLTHPDSMFDPKLNLTFARKLWETSGWRPWKSSIGKQ